VASITDSVKGIVFLGVTVAGLAVLALDYENLGNILTKRSLPQQMLEDTAAVQTAYNGLWPGYEDLLKTWKSEENAFRYTVLATLGTSAIGLVGTIAGILLPRTGILDVLYAIWKYVVLL
jgi:hypothetical protein